MGVFDFLSGKLVESVGKVADELFTSDDERLEKANEAQKTKTNYTVEMKKLDVDETKAMLEDKDSARDMNTGLIDSKDWLVRNTGSMLAWFVIVGTVVMDYLVVFNGYYDNVKDKEVLMFVLGSVNTYTASIISFYFGSSKTEADNMKIKR